MNLRQMEVFQAIMETGSVTAAARLLYVSQPAVTGVLRHAEDQLRFKLFERVRGRLQPTPEAQALYAEVVQVFERVDTVNRIATGLRTSSFGALRIVCIPAMGMAMLPRALGSFVATRPEVQARFEVRPRRDLVELVATGGADLGFGFLLPRDPRVVAEEIVTRDMVCLMHRSHPLTGHVSVGIEDLAQWPLIAYTSSQGLAPIINGIFAEARLEKPPGIEVGLIQNAWSLVSQNLGLALVDPHSGMGSMFPEVEERPFVPAIPVTLEMMHAESHPLSALAVRFAADLRDQAGAPRTPGREPSPASKQSAHGGAGA
jgi:DNA-binding transcriptional LysR family regulator